VNSLLSRAIDLLLFRKSSVAAITASFDKHRRELVELSARMREAARKAEEKAKALQAKAAAAASEAEHAVTVADRFGDLLKPKGE
jgi:glycine cleavage system regulatory protein